LNYFGLFFRGRYVVLYATTKSEEKRAKAKKQAYAKIFAQRPRSTQPCQVSLLNTSKSKNKKKLNGAKQSKKEIK